MALAGYLKVFFWFKFPFLMMETFSCGMMLCLIYDPLSWSLCISALLHLLSLFRTNWERMWQRETQREREREREREEEGRGRERERERKRGERERKREREHGRYGQCKWERERERERELGRYGQSKCKRANTVRVVLTVLTGDGKTVWCLMLPPQSEMVHLFHDFARDNIW